MATLGSFKEGSHRMVILGDKPVIQTISYGTEERLESKDKKASVILTPEFAYKGYFLAGPDINDNYYISDACGMAIQPKQGCCGH